MRGIIYLLFQLTVAYWVYQDAEKRKMSALWAVGAFFVPFVFLILYVIFRKPEPNLIEEDITRVCFNCGDKIRESDRYCHNCGTDTQNPR